MPIKVHSAPLCPYCSKSAVLCKGSEMPFRGNKTYAMRMFWACFGCRAWVGCHPLTSMPLGTLADADLRSARRNVHALLDPIWEAEMEAKGLPKHRARPQAYGWLARKLGISKDDCHIGMFDLPTCEKALRILQGHHQGVLA